MVKKSVFVTGAQGYIGKIVVDKIARHTGLFSNIVAHDLRQVSEKEKLPGVVYVQGDIRSDNFELLFREYSVDTVVHLASVVTPPKNSNPKLEYEVDVLGTENILKASVKHGVRHFIITSSGAAYGYHADNPEWLTENDALRGNDEFAYSRHKRLVEEMLARYRNTHPQLKQLVLRPGTILGQNTDNQITNMFKKSFVFGICGSLSPFVFILDDDVAEIIMKGIAEEKTGIYNVAGSGYCTLKSIAQKLGKPYLCFPSGILKMLLFVLHQLKLSRYGAHQVLFLKYRPVLSNKKLKEEFGYFPRYTSKEVFDYFIKNNLNKNKN